MIRPIIAYGDPVLRKEGEEIDENYPDLKLLLEDMFETMYNSQGVGLAAPQIGLAIRLFIVDASPFAEDEPELEGFKRVFINPIIIEETGKEWKFEEGCLSIPGIREDVSRKPDIIVEYYNEKFELVEEKLSGLAARVVQHEYDHIEGVLFTDKINPLKKQLIKKKLNDIAKGNIKVSYRMKFPLVKGKH
ncbi:peptide deformylase [Vicingus serpentipes]|jgi:peptide deformylase|uniref:Peptide deformylase n=1 Tax=Vicingus serpentipes TaxID=1926625 RepID=A0A5C6RV22_9FLAO|nr:peptide deformylase [Vicingus serpentipes]TXB66063.1 peptide deformylase [Vicingus serpentipes]